MDKSGSRRMGRRLLQQSKPEDGGGEVGSSSMLVRISSILDYFKVD